MDQASNISDEAKTNYDRASNEAKNAVTLSMELRENSDKKTLNKNKVIGHEFQRLNKTIKSSQNKSKHCKKENKN